jgi:hypothetical protein
MVVRINLLTASCWKSAYIVEVARALAVALTQKIPELDLPDRVANEAVTTR